MAEPITELELSRADDDGMIDRREQFQVEQEAWQFEDRILRGYGLCNLNEQ